MIEQMVPFTNIDGSIIRVPENRVEEYLKSQLTPSNMVHRPDLALPLHDLIKGLH